MKNEQVIEEFIKNNQKDLYRFAYSYVKNSDEALDIVQESIYKALDKCRTLKDHKKIKSWLFTIIRNTSLTHLKNRNKIRKKEVSLSLIPETREKESISKTDKIHLESIIKDLTKESQELIILRFYEDLKFNEISDVLKMNINTLKSRYYQLMDDLKKQYERSV